MREVRVVLHHKKPGTFGTQVVLDAPRWQQHLRQPFARGRSGFGVSVEGLMPGNYDLAVLAWSLGKGAFIPASVVRVTVR